jgi:hypothetical protein
VEVRYEGEEELHPAEHEHVVAAVVGARSLVPPRVVAVCLENRPAACKMTELEKEGRIIFIQGVT